MRKRPINDKELKQKDHDSVTCLQPYVWVHSAKFRVDGITKYLDNNSFQFDHAFDEVSSTEDVYKHSAMHLVNFLCDGKGGRATVFAYGQTGSGKTHTMRDIQTMVAKDMFDLLSKEHWAVNEKGCTMDDTVVTVSFFEIYGGKIQDLLNDCRRLKVLEDGKGEVVVSGLKEFQANDPNQLLELIYSANKKRTTHATEANDTSSRSHAICQIFLRDKKSTKLRGKLSLVDLAGSERGSNTKSHNRQRRTESSEINTSLLALKECIRAFDSCRGSFKHIPYRASKLTLILKDCFTSSLARTSMIATVSPGASSADHTLNTLRYAGRIKEKKVCDEQDSVLESNAIQKNCYWMKSDQNKASSLSLQSQRKETQEINFSSLDDLNILNKSLKVQSNDELSERKTSDEISQFHHTIQTLFEEEEALLNLHMSVIQVCLPFIVLE